MYPKQFKLLNCIDFNYNDLIKLTYIINDCGFADFEAHNGHMSIENVKIKS